MSTVTLSPDFRIQIPDDIREALKLSPGDEFRVVSLPGHVELIPVQSDSEREKAREEMRAYRGILRGQLKDTVIRDDYEDEL